MKKVVYLPLFLAAFSCRNSYNRSPHLPINGWKCKTGDSLAFADSSFDDRQWPIIQPSTIVKSQEYSDNNEFVWYRVKVYLPHDLSIHAMPTDSLKLYLGVIGEYDQAFINGFLFGQNNTDLPLNSAPSDTFSSSGEYNNIPRIYRLSIRDPRIHWGSLNTLAFRIFDRKGQHGLILGTPYISLNRLEDEISYNSDGFYRPKDAYIVDTILQMRNRSQNETLQGTLSIIAKNNGTWKTVFDQKVPVRIPPGSSARFPVSLPPNMDITTVYLSFDEPLSRNEARDSIRVPFVFSR